MSKIFDTLINSFLEHQIGITENFLGETLALHLKQNLNALYDQKQLLSAGTGNDKVVSHDKLVRSDVIYWLDRKHDDLYENEFFELMDHFVSYLNRTCYAGITGYEFHYTLYEKGSFYQKHFDQFKNNASRQYSMIMYLNTDWKKEDGGELCIHQQGKIQKISPDNGKSVFFKSDEIEHEVLLTHVPRLSITGWLKRN